MAKENGLIGAGAGSSDIIGSKETPGTAGPSYYRLGAILQPPLGESSKDSKGQGENRSLSTSTENIYHQPIKLKVRCDYRGSIKPSRFPFSSKNTERAAEEAREQQITLLRNVPMQGLQVEDVDLSFPIYHLFDDQLGLEVAFAPAEIIVKADSLEEVLPFIIREEFRKVDVLEPEGFSLSGYQLERLLFRLNSQVRSLIHTLQRRGNL